MHTRYAGHSWDCRRSNCIRKQRRGNSACLSLFGSGRYSSRFELRRMAFGGSGSSASRCMKIVIDMNLPPLWVPILENYGWECRHWSAIGSPSAEDSEIMEWAKQNDFVVFTHDLDFGALLAASGAERPSVFQIRTLDVRPKSLETLVVAALKQFEAMLEEGALVTVDEKRSRARVLPLLR